MRIIYSKDHLNIAPNEIIELLGQKFQVELCWDYHMGEPTVVILDRKEKKEFCPHGEKKRSVEPVAFAGGTDICSCCQNWFGHFGGQGDKPLCPACREKPC